MKNDNIDKGNIYKPIYYGNWEERILYDLAVWKNGLAFKNINFTDIGKPVIKIAELKNGITSQTKFTQDIFDDSVYLTKGDMLFSWSGNPETSIDVFYYDLPDGWLNQHIFKITTKDDVFYEYFFYILKYLKPNFTVIATNKQTTGLGHVTINDLKRIKIKLPPLEEQKKIASILSSLDDKIELNNRMNKILEETAQTIFKEWFINFNFPNEEGKPYKKSGGKMIESELGEIPEGWEVDILSNIFDISIGKTPPRKETECFSNNDKDMKWVSISDMGKSGLYLLDTSEYLTLDAVNKYNVIIVPKDTIILSFKLTIGRVSIVYEDMTTNEAIAHIKTNNKKLNEYTYFYLKNFKYSTLGSTSSIAQAVNSKLIKSIKFMLPDTNILNDFHLKTKDIFNKIKYNQIENQKLAGIRDSILPKLMSGEIRIK
ncbi:restriction endonuclease subunit S [Brachyspira intermedia]|uniref:restriction endonuclease subunit S n=1 Tax=Brachyspira intermedia TaxID=84377 RepID=UPI00300669DF